MKSLVKTILRQTPYQVTKRTATNRFQAIGDSLVSLSRRGYKPKRVIDAGANVGDFAKDVLQLFPDALVHAIEPQPGCQSDLEAIKARVGSRVVTHATALSSPENDGVTVMLETDNAQRSTGAHVTIATLHSSAFRVVVPCTTLDRLLAPYRKEDDHALLKLDLQGYELHALRGAVETLTTTDVVLTEVSFFAQAYEPPIAELVAFLSLHGFELYDVCSLFGRPRDGRARQGDFLFIKRTCELAADKLWD